MGKHATITAMESAPVEASGKEFMVIREFDRRKRHIDHRMNSVNLVSFKFHGICRHDRPSVPANLRPVPELRLEL